MNWIFRTTLILVMLHPASVVLAQASITLTGPSSTSYMAPANFDLRADYYVSSGPKAEFIEDPVITQNGSPIARLLEGAVPVRGLPAGRYEYMFTGRAVRILPDGDMTSRPLRSGPIVIDVTSPPEPVDAGAPGATSYPNPSLAGRPGSVSIQMINTGETTWRAGTYVLDTPHDFTRDFWQFTAQPVTHDVAPGASFTFNFSITPRYYDQHVEWRNIEFQLRRDQSWFGLKSYTSIFVREPMNAATFESQSVPLQMEAGKQYAINVRMRNTGDDPWSSAAGYSLGSQNPADNTIWGTHRIQTGSVAPGSVGDFSATVTAPAAAGTYSFQWRMVRDGVEWFGVQTPSITVNVIAPPPPPPLEIIGTAFAYDALGRVVGTSSESELGPLVTATAYLPGNREAHSNARGRVTTTTYQGYDTPGGARAIKVEEPEGRITHVDRNRFGTILRVARDIGTRAIERHYVYDEHHRMCKTIEPESGTTAVGYDATGRLLWKTNGLDLPSLQTCDSDAAQASPRTVRQSYDLNGRLEAISSPDGDGSKTFRYAPDGKLLEATATNSGVIGPATTRLTYNSRRKITSETSSLPGLPDWTVSYGYDANGSLATRILPSGVELRYMPDALGLPRQITDQHGRAFASGIMRSAGGAISSFVYGNGTGSTVASNERNLPMRITSSPALDIEYDYDESSNIVKMTEHAGPSIVDRVISYDGVDRLIRVASSSSNLNESFSYDQADNLVWSARGEEHERTFYRDQKNRLTNVADEGNSTVIGQSYDLAGNISNKNGNTHFFDLHNLLRSYAGDNYYGYDALDRRVAKGAASSQAIQRSMYLSTGEIAQTSNIRVGTTTSYVALDGKAIASITAHSNGTSEVTFHHLDLIGNPVADTDSSGAVVHTSFYSAYGISRDNNVSEINFTGHVKDSDTQLIYMQSRYYDPETHSFISVDPIPSIFEPVSLLNRYNYGFGNPYRFVDLDGRLAEDVNADTQDQPQTLERVIVKPPVTSRVSTYGSVFELRGSPTFFSLATFSATRKDTSFQQAIDGAELTNTVTLPALIVTASPSAFALGASSLPVSAELASAAPSVVRSRTAREFIFHACVAIGACTSGKMPMQRVKDTNALREVVEGAARNNRRRDIEVPEK